MKCEVINEFLYQLSLGSTPELAFERATGLTNQLRIPIGFEIKVVVKGNEHENLLEDITPVLYESSKKFNTQ